MNTKIHVSDRSPLCAGSFGESFDRFLRSLAGHNCSPATLKAYCIDVGQFLIWLSECTAATRPAQVTRAQLIDYLAYLTDARISGTTRRRKRAALRSYFAFLVDEGLLTSSPAETVPAPRLEKRHPVWLKPEEYNRMLAQASDTRDFAILQLFLQTGIRLAELCALEVSDVELSTVAPTLHVRVGKGLKDRDIPLERKAIDALKRWLKTRPPVTSEALFLNRYGQPFSMRGIEKLIAKYRQRAAIAKRVGPHALRHTYGTNKARQGVTALQLQELMGHDNIANTQRYMRLAMQDVRSVQGATSL